MEFDYVTKRDSGKCGELHLVMGPMYSGKSTKLIETYKSLLDSGCPEKSNIVVVTHSIETRYSMDKLSSHDRKEVECTKVSNVQSIVNACTNNVSNNIQLAEYILIDEAQFFSDLMIFKSLFIFLFFSKVSVDSEENKKISFIVRSLFVFISNFNEFLSIFSLLIMLNFELPFLGTVL